LTVEVFSVKVSDVKDAAAKRVAAIAASKAVSPLPPSPPTAWLPLMIYIS